MGLKRTRKQKKGGAWTKARRGVIGNWWGNCDDYKDDDRLKTRCLLDQERSWYEAHFEDPFAIYKDAAKETFKKKITARAKNKRLSQKIWKILIHLDENSTKAQRDTIRQAKPIRQSKIKILVFDSENNSFTIEINNDASVKELKDKIKSTLYIQEDQKLDLYKEKRELSDKSNLSESGIGNYSTVTYKIDSESNDLNNDATVGIISNDDENYQFDFEGNDADYGYDN